MIRNCREFCDASHEKKKSSSSRERRKQALCSRTMFALPKTQKMFTHVIPRQKAFWQVLPVSKVGEQKIVFVLQLKKLM
jgi:hypothetical protein